MALFRRKQSTLFWMSFSANGQQYQRSCGTADRKLAEAILGKIKAQIIEEKWFDLDKARGFSFEDMMEKYFKEHAPIHKEESSVQRDKDSYTHLKQVFSDLTLDKITPSLVIDYRNKRLAEGAAHSTVLNELGLLRNAFNISIRHWKWCRENPAGSR